MAQAQPRIVALLHGEDQPGIVWKVSGWIYQRGGNIIHADQHRDGASNIFFQRLEWDPLGRDPLEEMERFRVFAEVELEMRVRTCLSTYRAKLGVLVSKVPHCFHDLIIRGLTGELPGDIVCVISNHTALRSEAQRYGLPFYHVPVTDSNRDQAEAEQVRLLKAHDVKLVVLARYMQVLSGGMLDELDVPVINIHHSFLPAFSGARPYHQAHRRGVKIIGATAHYATAELDAGPIIQQEVARVSHRHSVEELIRKGRDLEKTVLAQAVRWHLEHRALAYGNKTVVFD